ncbi:MAG: prepilin-type N-terminal cleavage/methylation domain-containing protein [Alphaproteobacteria bacterium]|nr:prepilin-type N-terminal cleavage/methylation domain-containing protein [Alphaproteobacteria bacterium]
MIRYSKQKGFTLIEMAIILIVVGLLIGGVLKGEEMVESMRIKQTMRQWNEVKSAWLGFYGKYNGIPGDFNRATQLIASNDKQIVDGNGDNEVSRRDFGRMSNGLQSEWVEFRYVWNHLDVSGFLGGVDAATAVYSDKETNLNPDHVGVIPDSERLGKLNAKFPGVEFIVMTDSKNENHFGSLGPIASAKNPLRPSLPKEVGDNGFINDGNHYIIVSQRNNYYNVGDFNYRDMEPALSGRIASYIDRKYDNDDNKSGQIYYFCNLQAFFDATGPLTDPLGEGPACKMQLLVSNAR